jgi:hypothetical protein
MDSTYILCSKPPACLLVRFATPCGLVYPSLPNDVQPIFPSISSGSICDMQTKKEVAIVRTQIPGTPAFAITDIKAQGQSIAALETSLRFSRVAKSAHYKWTSLNVQLGRLTSSRGLCLREHITFEDVSYRPDPQLKVEEERFRTGSVETRARWLAQLSMLA